METVKSLETAELHQYSIEKDRFTGEHYLLYAFMHRDAATGLQEEIFHHLLPLESDDVLALVLGEQPFTYPDHWRRSFLRDGPDGFSPTEPESAEDQVFQRELLEGLAELKQKGGSEEDIRKLLERLHGRQDE